MSMSDRRAPTGENGPGRDRSRRHFAANDCQDSDRRRRRPEPRDHHRCALLHSPFSPVCRRTTCDRGRANIPAPKVGAHAHRRCRRRYDAAQHAFTRMPMSCRRHRERLSRGTFFATQRRVSGECPDILGSPLRDGRIRPCARWLVHAMRRHSADHWGGTQPLSKRSDDHDP